MPKPKRNINAVAEETLTPPTALEPTQSLARLKTAAGKNLYHVELPTGETVLSELPARFRSTIWLKRGCYLVVDTATLGDRDNKIKGEIVNVVGDEKAWRKAKFWPKEFGVRKSVYEDESEDEGPQMPPSDSEDE